MSSEKLKKQKREWYQRNREKVIAYKNNRRKELQSWIRSLRISCERCGEDHPATLDFHHTNGSDKTITLGKAARQGWSKERILEEVQKCEVLCSNCHRKEHAPY
jgi:hypothetical protein